MGITFRGGLKPNDPTKPRLLLRPFLTGAPLTPPPKAVDWDAKVSAFGMLGNSEWGDCVFAANGHALQTWTANASTEILPTDHDTLQAYSEVTGFDPHAGPPGQNPTDQGTVMQDAMDYWRKTGLPVGSTRHKILAFAQVDHTSLIDLELAAAIFGEVLFGIDFPDTAMDQFDRGEPWDAVPGATIEGGHAVCCARYDGARWYVITWGREQEVTVPFLSLYLTEAWVAIAPEWIAANGTTPSGIDLAGLGDDFSKLTGEDNPFTPPEPPSPRPDALVAAARALSQDQGVLGWLSHPHVGHTKHVAGLVRAVVDAANAS